jgi:NhaA family Na+:H+ antiporter
MILTRYFKEFFESERSGGFLLLLGMFVSLLLTNVVVGEEYVQFWLQKLPLTIGPVEIKLSIEHWINDLLMAVFFLLVGLEIERELYIGELSDVRAAVVPVAAAIGGLVVPALIHFAFNAGLPTQSGFGIPMATDIAFALGVLSLTRAPVSWKVFLTALAIIDDMGAILIIAMFYTQLLAWNYLLVAAVVSVMLIVLNRLHVMRLWVYLVGGIVLWYCMLKSGVHATVAGVLLAFLIPFRKGDDQSPSWILQHALHKPVAFVILPIFALANTCVVLTGTSFAAMIGPNNLGIFLGLAVGKPAGILVATWVTVKAKWGAMSDDMNFKAVLSLGCLGGIGFTMSIFITNLALTDPSAINMAKATILVASLVMAVTGWFFCNAVIPKEKTVEINHL